MFCVYRDVLGPRLNEAIYAEALALRDRFERSRTSAGRVDTSTRLSTVVYDQHLTRSFTIMRQAGYDRLEEALPRLGMSSFPMGDMEIQMTAHNDGEFFKRHSDSGSRATASRTLTFVYYFHGRPKRYSGGEIVFLDDEGNAHVIEPANDSMVLFDSKTWHEIRPVSCPSRRFEDGRFTLNGWIHRRGDEQTDRFFDQRIFTPIGSWPGMALRATASTGSAMPPDAAPSARHAQALLALYGDLHRSRAQPPTVDVRPSLSGAEFFEQYFCSNRPVLIPGALSSSEAVARWSPEYFANHYGHVSVDITSERASVPNYEIEFRQTVHTVTLRDFVGRLVSDPASNEFYLVARNNFFDNPRLRHLRNQLTPPADIINDRDWSPGATKLWFGPEGTVTPLHFDEHSILFTQIYGQKQFKLIPSFDYRFVYPRDHYYSEVDPEAVDLERHPLFTRACVMDETVRPGDALLIPAGWWHWVRASSVSISATFSSFMIDNGNVRLSRSAAGPGLKAGRRATDKATPGPVLATIGADGVGAEDEEEDRTRSASW